MTVKGYAKFLLIMAGLGGLLYGVDVGVIAAALPYIEQKKLEPWTHNKAIQKAVESYRITPEQKEYLKQFRIPSK